ncbi:MAG: voltage-gated chloride channel family protein [Flavobacteriales bacterium]
MDFKTTINQYVSEYKPILIYCLKWIILSLAVGILSGSASALLLVSLEFATDVREHNLWIVALLPLAGLVIGLLYHYFGQDVVKGNNQILDEYHEPQKRIPIKMAPFVLIGTFLTHLFGGAAGREGSAVQMGSSIADQFSRFFTINALDRKILLIIGISGGFASVFGTPLAGAIFALEVLVIGRMRYEAILPSILTAIFAHLTCHLWNVHHTIYSIPEVPGIEFSGVFWSIFCGIIFGLAAILFSKTTHYFSHIFKTKIAYPPLRPFIGGIIIAIVVFFVGQRYLGLGVPIIESAFDSQLWYGDFFIKLLFTAFTLGAGFKGGEVTPLFFIGATLGNALFLFVPLPMALLAGMGFVAVFSGATNTPIACIFMGIELFGAKTGVYLGISCIVAYLASGHSGIYSSQVIGSPKNQILELKSRFLRNL